MQAGFGCFPYTENAQHVYVCTNSGPRKKKEKEVVIYRWFRTNKTIWEEKGWEFGEKEPK